MAFFADFVRETAVAPGTATFNLAGAEVGYQGFVAAGANGKTVYYSAHDGTNWEVGYGTVTDAATDTLSRTVIASSNANAAVNFLTTPKIDLVLPAKLVPSHAVISDTKAANTAGGTFTSGAWRTRDLNTEDYDPDGIVSISSNQFTLQAGTYRISARAPGAGVAGHKALLYNVTDASNALIGSSEYPGTLSQSDSIIIGLVTLTGAKSFEVRHWATATKATDGFGVASNVGVSEVYTVVEITKIA